MVPESKMPAYPWLVESTLDGQHTPAKMKALRMLGVPYSDEDIAGAADARLRARARWMPWSPTCKCSALP